MERSLSGVLVLAGLVASLAACSDDDSAATSTAPVTSATTASSSEGTDSTPEASPDDSAATTTTISAADASEDDYLAAIKRSLSAGSGGQMQMTPEQADCVAPKWLETIGVERLKVHDISPAQIGDDVDDDGSALEDLGLTDEQGNASFDSFGECDVDIEQEFMTALTDQLAPEAATCVADALDEALLRRLMVSVIVRGSPDDEVGADFETAIASCEELADGSAPTTTAG